MGGMMPTRAAAAALALLLAAGPAVAQEAVEASVAAPAEESLLTTEEIDALVAPVALYPDALLSQIFVAATYPLDVVKADRFVAENAALSDDERADAAEAEDWDPSVGVLAAGFPDVVTRMAEEVEWTEQLGEAVLVQTGDVLDSVQRLRAQASATGYLETNEAQVVEVDDGAISIAPADPEVVYVPSYDPAMAYTSAPTGAPVIATDPGMTTGDILTTGAIAFGSAMLVEEIFDDDDDWDDYWRGPPRIDWDDADFHPRPDIDVEGDVNINRGRITDIDRDRVDIDRDRIGDIDRDRLEVARDRGWEPSEDRRQEARDKIADRKASGDGARRTGAQERLAARSGGGDDARAKLRKASEARKPTAARRPPDSALKPKPASAPKVHQAKTRAVASGKRPTVQKVAPQRPKVAAKPTRVARPAQVSRPTASRSSSRSSVFKKSGGSRATHASARGRSSKHRGRR